MISKFSTVSAWSQCCQKLIFRCVKTFSGSQTSHTGRYSIIDSYSFADPVQVQLLLMTVPAFSKSEVLGCNDFLHYALLSHFPSSA